MCSARRLVVLYICVKFRENISDEYQSYGADANDGSADGRTDTQNFGRYNIIPSPLFVSGHNESRYPNAFGVHEAHHPTDFLTNESRDTDEGTYESFLPVVFWAYESDHSNDFWTNELRYS